MNMKKFLGINWTKKKIIWTSIIVLVVAFIGYRIHTGSNAAANIQTDTVKKQNLQQTVLSTGQVVSSTDLNLSFKSSGVVTKVTVKEGDKVKQGQVLATLDQSSALASLTTAQGSLASAKANYEKVLAGASNEQIAAAQVALSNATSALASTKTQQDTTVRNAYSTLLNTAIAATPGSSNGDNVLPTIFGTYTGQAQGVYSISVYSTGSGLKFQVSGLEVSNGDVKNQPVALGTRGLYIQFGSNPAAQDTWAVNIPNIYASTYVANYNAYQAALQAQAQALISAQSAVDTAQANLAVQQAQARPADVDAAQAQILSAQGQVGSAYATVQNTVVAAPADGTITQVDIKVGEQANAQGEVMVLQDIGNLHAESNVSEADIASLQVGQSVDYTFDALGPDRHFKGAVLTINPASTVVSGVVNYKVTASLENIPEIKPGMTANMTILVAQKDNVLSVPSQAVINQNSKQYVRVIDDAKKKTYHQVQVQTGLQADGGLVEITSGLSEGQEVVTYIKQ